MGEMALFTASASLKRRWFIQLTKKPRNETWPLGKPLFYFREVPPITIVAAAVAAWLCAGLGSIWFTIKGMNWRYCNKICGAACRFCLLVVPKITPTATLWSFRHPRNQPYRYWLDSERQLIVALAYTTSHTQERPSLPFYCPTRVL